MDDVQKLEFLAEIIATMNPAFKQTVINELARGQSVGEAEIKIYGDADTVHIKFDRALAFIRLPKAHAVQLAVQLLQAGGAQIQRSASPGADANDVIDIKP